MGDISDFRLKVFRQAAWELSFSKAARELFISQPAVTKHIRELETVFNTKLFDRSGNRLALTPAGELLLKHCETLLNGYGKLEYEMHCLNNRHVGSLRIGASLTIAQYILPETLTAFHRKFPEISLELQMHNTLEIEELLREQKIDVGLVEGPSRNPCLHYAPFLRDEIVAVVRSEAPLAEAYRPEQIGELPFVVREQHSGTTRFIAERLREIGIDYASLNFQMILGSTESIKSCLLHSDYVGLLSVFSIRRELADGLFRILDFGDFSIERNFCLVQNQGDSDGAPRLFCDFVRAHIRELYGKAAF